MTSPQPENVGWERLCREEPRLDALAKAARRFRADTANDPRFCRRQTWAAQFAPEVANLTGWTRQSGHGPAWLRSDEAHALARKKILHALPPCRGCNCPDAEEAGHC